MNKTSNSFHGCFSHFGNWHGCAGVRSSRMAPKWGLQRSVAKLFQAHTVQSPVSQTPENQHEEGFDQCSPDDESESSRQATKRPCREAASTCNGGFPADTVVQLARVIQSTARQNYDSNKYDWVWFLLFMCARKHNHYRKWLARWNQMQTNFFWRLDYTNKCAKTRLSISLTDCIVTREWKLTERFLDDSLEWIVSLHSCVLSSLSISAVSAS